MIFEHLGEKINENEKKILLLLIESSQLFCHKNCDESNPVSLRDATRCILLIKWFLEIQNFQPNPFHYYNFNYFKVIIILALNICYSTKFYENNKVKNLQENWVLIDLEMKNEKLIQDCYQQCQDQLVKCFEFPKNIYLNKSLKENIFFEFICVLNKIPLFIIGKPGTSKSLSISIFLSQMKGRRSIDPFLRNFPCLQDFFLQCSQQTSDIAIREIFEEAIHFQENVGENNIISLVILDEVGLVELNKNLPLKILHGLLDNCKISFIGISNWTLDSSKMNRAVN